MLFWRHTVTAHLLTVRATVTGAHTHAMCGRGRGAGRKGKAPVKMAETA